MMLNLLHDFTAKGISLDKIFILETVQQVRFSSLLEDNFT
jgi:hypothetical protein